MNKLLVDTNILIYAKDRSSIFHSKSQALLNSSLEFYTTSKNLSEYYAATTKGITPLLSSVEALADLEEFSNNLNILFANELSISILKSLVKIHHPKGLLIHDFEIASIGLAHHVTHVATFNREDFKTISEIELIDF